VARNPVINRRNVTPLKRRTVYASDTAMTAIADLAKHLQVSQGSLVDTALHALASHSDRDVIDFLAKHGHLTPAEQTAVLAAVGLDPNPKPPRPGPAPRAPIGTNPTGDTNMRIVPNPRAGRPIHQATRPDGTRYRYEMICNGGSQRAYADSMTELIGALIPDYVPMTDNESNVARLRYSKNLEAALQAQFLMADPDAVTDEQRDVLLTSRRDPLNIDHWDANVPLVAVTIDYEPYYPLPQPTGNVVWIDPSDEATFLYSLNDLGHISLAIAETSH
jgi:hypothetical protein